MLNLLIMGPAGAGKGTMSEKIKSFYNVAHISTGDMFRENIKNNTELGKLAQTYISGGHLVPDDVTIAMVNDRIQKDDCKAGYLLDGFPRSLAQAKSFDELVENTGLKLTVVLNLCVDEESLISRIENRRLCKKCGNIYNLLAKPTKVEGVCDDCGGELYQRVDDNRERLVVRMAEYHKETAPVLEHYKEKGLVCDINASQPIDSVWEDVKKVLDQYLD